jgi:hypothetical protein
MNRFVLRMPITALVTIFAYSLSQIKEPCADSVILTYPETAAIFQKMMHKSLEQKALQASSRPKRTIHSIMTRYL